MAIPATQMRPGMIIKHNDQLHLVFKVEHRTPGNLRAFIQAKLRNIRTGAMFEERFRSADAIEKVVVDEVSMEFLYADGDDYYFMNPVDYEQTVLKGSTLGDAVEYLTPNLQIKVSYHDGQAVGIDLPAAVELDRRRDRAGPQVGHRLQRHQARQDRNRPRGPGSRPSSTKAKRSASIPAKAPT
jgi:elongation factor P